MVATAVAAVVVAVAATAGDPGERPGAMGYDLHITRAMDWTDNTGQLIDESEWLELAAADQDLTADPANGPFAVRFRRSAWFDWFEGNVFTTDPDRATVQKMLLLAHQLSAIVQGDGGEIYESAQQWPPKTPKDR